MKAANFRRLIDKVRMNAANFRHLLDSAENNKAMVAGFVGWGVELWRLPKYHSQAKLVRRSLVRIFEFAREESPGSAGQDGR